MNKVYKKTLYLGLILGILSPFNFASAYSVGTHAFLTKEAIEFYNKNLSGNKISDELKNYIIDGARLEDNAPRYVNHFYDPVKDSGLADLGFRGQKSKDWAQDSPSQTALLYKAFAPTEASILSLAQLEKISSVFDQTDFTWKKAVNLYVSGKTEESLFALGHIIHLVEDMSVPDHVRNDAHPPYDGGGSPYENWTAKFNLDAADKSLKSRLTGKKPVALGDLDSYFTELAKYTNSNFYSEDSIENYSSPIFDFKKEDGFNLYGFKYDENGDAYRLVRISEISKKYEWKNQIQLSNKSLILQDSDKTLTDGGDNLIVSDYWDRLSVKSVQYSAGLIDLFFKEVEKEKNKPKQEVPIFSRYFGQVIDLLKDFIPDFSGNQNLNLASVIDLADRNPEQVENPSIDSQEATGGGSEFINVQDFVDDDQDEDLTLSDSTEDADVSAEEIVPVAEVVRKTAQVCTFNTDESPSRDKFLINEVAWMGGINSANDEWIELRNISGGVLDISGWQLLDKAEQIKITFGNIRLDSGAYLLLERTDDNSILEVKADAVYAGALSNSDEGLRLFDSECNLADEVLANSDWPAGDASARRTMERATDLSWHIYAGGGTVKGGISLFGTPKQDNSQPGVASASSALVASPVNSSAVPSGPAKILISEVQITGGTGKTNNDFVELYNPNTSAVNLNGYRLVKRTKTGTTDSSVKSWTADVYIPAKGYYLWANSGYSDISSTPDITTSSTLANDNGIAIRYGSSDTGELIDSVAWGVTTNAFVENQAFPDNPITNQSISRQSESDTNNNSVDFIKTLLSPKNSSNSGGFIVPTAWSNQPASAVSYPLISEVYPDRTGANLDFVEIYNPNASGTPLILTGWSLQVLSANATSTDKIVKKNFENSNAIPASGFFLIGIDSNTGGDMNWASGSLNSTDGATIFLVNGTTTISDFEDPNIIDRIAYGTGSGLMSPENSAGPMPDSGKSLERKSLQSNLCVSASGSGEYLGNGCDTDDNSSDFQVRDIPKPQKLSNLLEPRNSPSAPAGFSASYSTTTLRVSFIWNPSSDSAGATSTMSYVLQSATSTNPLIDLATVSATSTYDYKISEVGIYYNFSIKAKDADGSESSASTASLSAPSVLDSAYFYPDPRTSGVNAVEFRYGTYPFIYSETSSGFRVAVLYKNQEAPALPYFYSDTQFATTPEGVYPTQYGEWGSQISSAWKLNYANCASVNTTGTALILPDSGSYCSSGFGGIRNSTLDIAKLEDLNLIVSLNNDQAPVAGDYFTLGFYTLTGNNTQTLAAVDRQKYYFSTDVPAHASPSVPADLELSYNSGTSLLRMIWDRSSDVDSLDNLLNYEINYSTTTLSDSGWIPAPSAQMDAGEGSEINGRPFTKISVEPNTTYNIAFRSKDDFGNVSDATTTSFSVPDTVLPYGMANFEWGNVGASGNPQIIFDANAYPFMSSNKATAILFFLNQSVPAGHSFSNSANRYEIGGNNKVLKLSYSTCDNANDDILGGLLMHNQTSCPNGSGLKKYNTRNNLTGGQTNFTTAISGVFEDGGAISHTFASSDYVTVGFYELNGSTFQQVSVYNKKTYFSE